MRPCFIHRHRLRAASPSAEAGCGQSQRIGVFSSASGPLRSIALTNTEFFGALDGPPPTTSTAAGSVMPPDFPPHPPRRHPQSRCGSVTTTRRFPIQTAAAGHGVALAIEPGLDRAFPGWTSEELKTARRERSTAKRMSAYSPRVTRCLVPSPESAHSRLYVL